MMWPKAMSARMATRSVISKATLWIAGIGLISLVSTAILVDSVEVSVREWLEVATATVIFVACGLRLEEVLSRPRLLTLLASSAVGGAASSILFRGDFDVGDVGYALAAGSFGAVTFVKYRYGADAPIAVVLATWQVLVLLIVLVVVSGEPLTTLGGGLVGVVAFAALSGGVRLARSSRE